MQIIPAILPKDFADLEDHVARVKSLVPLVQVDICDGQFTPLPSWPYKKHDSNFDEIVKEDRGLPFWEEVEYEFDLMVNKPEDVVEKYVAAGASHIVLHVEAKGDIAKAIEKLEGKVEIGLALNIETPLDQLQVESKDEKIPLVKGGGERSETGDFKSGYDFRFQYIQLMGIDNVGFQGQIFDEKVIAKIKEVKKKYPNLEIQIDGGVNLETASLLKAAGADRLVIGSAIFESENVVEAVERFKNL
jgi:ribulose-phosphate 3-epimerase